MSGELLKKRRRLRLSCIECTTRRQRCDRQTPCGLCLKRGVPEQCLYSLEPYTRPQPKRSARDTNIPGRLSSPSSESGSTSSEDAQQKTIDALQARIASLENTISSLKLSSGSEVDRETEEVQPDLSQQHTLEQDLLPPGTKPFDYEGFAEVTARLRRDLASKGEYVGRPRVLGVYIGKPPNETDILIGGGEEASAVEEGTLSLDYIDMNLPPSGVLQVLVHRFILEENWRFGLLYPWLFDMTASLSGVHGIPGFRFKTEHCPKLALLCAVIGYTLSGYSKPPDLPIIQDPSFWMNCALSARRLAHAKRDEESIEYSCAAVLIICPYFIDRGRVPDAWLIIGHALRDAVSSGMHECVLGNYALNTHSSDRLSLKRRIWYMLVMPDRFYSHGLGRPAMVNDDLFQKGMTLNEKLTKLNGHDEFLQLQVALWSIMIESSSTAFKKGSLDSRRLFVMDRKLEAWLNNLPLHLQKDRLADFETSSLPLSEKRIHMRQWAALKRRCLLARSKMHIISMLHGKPLRTQEEARLSFTRTQSRDICLSLVTELLTNQRDLCQASNLFTGRTDCEPVGDLVGNNWMFEGCLALFEAATVLIGLMSQFPVEERLSEHEELVDFAIGALHTLSIRCSAAKAPKLAHELLSGLAQRQSWRRSIIEPNASVTGEAQPATQETTDIWSFMDTSQDPTAAFLAAPAYNGLFKPVEQQEQQTEDLSTWPFAFAAPEEVAGQPLQSFDELMATFDPAAMNSAGTVQSDPYSAGL